MIAPADQVLGIRAKGNHLRAQCWNPGFVGVALSQLLEARLRVGSGGGWGGWHIRRKPSFRVAPEPPNARRSLRRLRLKNGVMHRLGAPCALSIRER